MVIKHSHISQRTNSSATNRAKPSARGSHHSLCSDSLRLVDSSRLSMVVGMDRWTAAKILKVVIESALTGTKDRQPKRIAMMLIKRLQDILALAR